MELTNIKTLLIAGVSVSLLASCGGGGGGGNEPKQTNTPTPTPTYKTLDSTTGTSDMAGAAIISGGDGSLSLGRKIGSVDHTTQTITTSHDGTVVVSDLESEYDYTTMYTQSYTVDGSSFDATGVGGIVTSTVDMPEPGVSDLNVSYTGESRALLVQADAGYEMSGQSTIDVNFGSGNVDVRMDEFVATDLTTGEAVANPISVISIDNASISGNQISGGVFSVTNGDGVVDIAGANSTSDMQGNFFGYDAGISAPDEVGGVFLHSGDGILSGGFIAD